MKQFRVLIGFAAALLLSGCSLFGGGDDDQSLSTSEQITPEPTANIVQAVPAESPTASEAGAPLPTAVTLPPTPVPPEPTVDRSQPITYVVQSGDVLGIIAERFDVDIAELRRVNGLSGNLIRVGQELTIPAIAGGTETASPPAAATSPPTSPTSAPGPVTCGGGTGHCVQPGESLTGIASQYGVTVDQLRAANPSIVGDFIAYGDLLTIPGGASPPAGDPVPPASGSPTTGPTVGPLSDADCAAANPEFPYYHAGDGRCYANPISGGGTPTPDPTATGADPDVVCPGGTFLWQDGYCYPIPGTTVTVGPDVTVTVIATAVPDDYGSPPCRDGYVELPGTGKCWPEATNPNPATVVPNATATPTPTP